MRIRFIGGALAAATASFLAASPAAAQGQCARPVQQYRDAIDLASRYQALNQVMGDQFTPTQQAASEARESNAMSRARMAREALRSAGCRTAALVPSADPYLPAARLCLVETIRGRWGGSLPENCDPNRWTRRR